MFHDFASATVGIIVAAAIVVPNVICSVIWVWFTAVRVVNKDRELEEWRAIATNAAIRSGHQQQPPQQLDIDDLDADDFPSH